MSDSPAHTPVMLRAVVELLRPERAPRIADCTVGLGGHAEALLERQAPDGTYLAIDLDAENLRRARRRLKRFDDGRRVRWFHADYADLPEVLAAAGVERLEGLLADLGVASTQFDEAQRGFSFAADAPLDMRLNVEGSGPTAAELVNRLDERALADLLYHNADEHRSRRIARAIVEARRRKPIERTVELAEIVQRALGGRRGARIHPATRTFQALRIAVNRELESLDRLLSALPEVLTSGGRAAIISFHSQEDRRVKHAFSAMESAGTGRIITPKPVVADDEEVRANPRSRSAKLRCVERT